MNTRRVPAVIALVMGVSLFAVAGNVSAQDNPLIGTWELDRFNSVYEPIEIAPQRQRMEIASAAAPGQFTVVTTSWRVDPGNQGSEVASHTTYTAALDGKDYPTSAPRATVAFKRTSATTIERTAKLMDEVAETAVWTLSGGGALLSIQRSGVDARGMKYRATQRYKRVR